MMSVFMLSSEASYTHEDIYRIAYERVPIQLHPQVIENVKRNRDYLEKKIKDGTHIVYGINTGFGSLCNVVISEQNLEQLQTNLVLSHACGMGDPMPKELVRILCLLKIINLSKGYSGIRPALLQSMVDLYNLDIMPVIYTQGSLGASGDLAPLAHMALPLIGYGEVYYQDDIHLSQSLIDKNIYKHTPLASKEGLALLNGTQFSLTYAVDLTTRGMRLLKLMNVISALSIEAYMCDLAPFDHLLHMIRPHPGQLSVAQDILNLIGHNTKVQKKIKSVQDPYSFRCIPQVHGASLDALHHTQDIINREISAVTDNPSVFDREDKILSGGNFHAQPLALVLDYATLALCELASISERRIYQLINGDRDLPPFLVDSPGLNSGFMIAQYTAASIVSQNKQYATPASVDSIISSKGQEDHVSMAANAATKSRKVLENVISVAAIELLIACQALDYRNTETLSPDLNKLYTIVRNMVSHMPQDRLLHDDIDIVRQWIAQSLDEG